MALEIAQWLPLFPVRESCLYLNHAAVAPLPQPVAEAMRARIAEQEAVGSANWRDWVETEMSVRALAADLVGCRPEDVTLVRSTSEGLSLVTGGLGLGPGDAVLVSDEDFAANVAPYLMLQRDGVEVRRFPAPGGKVVLDELVPLLQPPVRVLGLSWVSFHTGWVAPVAELVDVAHARGILVVLDAIQGLGVLPDTFPELGVDALVADGHKWLLAPEGLGVMVTTPELRHRLEPVLAGWLNVEREEHSMFLSELRFHRDGRRFEPGATPTILVAGLAAALELLLDAGLGEIHARVAAHNRTLARLLLELGWQVGSPGPSNQLAGIVAARHPYMPSHEVAKRLHERQIEVSARQGWVRFSPHFYATAGELEALKVILAKL
ncbi:MAG: aminotransferase class V-fold PLP-dependent enzyme [Thermoanaerobaculaceae bacterium]